MAAAGAGVKPQTIAQKTNLINIIFMKFSNLLTRFSSLLTIALLAGAWGILPATLQAAEPNGNASATSRHGTVVRFAG